MQCVEEISLEALFDLDEIEALPSFDVPDFMPDVPAIAFTFTEAGTSSATACTVSVTFVAENPYDGVLCYAQSPYGLCAEESPWYRRDVIPGSSLADLGMSASEGARGLLMSPWNLIKGLYGGIQGIGSYGGYMYEDPSGTLQATGQVIQNLPETVPAALEEWASDPYAIGSTVGEIGTGIGAVKAVSAASKASPWVGKIAVHGPHAGGPHQYRHLQIMIRTGKSTTRHIRIPPR